MTVERNPSHLPHIGAVVLAAGRSSRMGGANKLLELIRGAAVIAHVVDAAIEAGATPIVVVTGHRADDVAAAIGARPVTVVANPRWADGMSTSLAAGIAALEGRVDGALICLGDMPSVTARDLRALIETFGNAHTRAAWMAPAACVPVHDGRRGNPVLWSSSLFPSLRALQGDQGAKGMLREMGDRAREVPAGPGVLIDVDTPEELEKARGARD